MEEKNKKEEGHQATSRRSTLSLAMCLRQLTPCWKEGKTTEPYLHTSGRARTLMITSVTTPKVPGGGRREGVVKKRL